MMQVCDLFAFELEWKPFFFFFFHFCDKPFNNIWVKMQKPVRRGRGWVTMEARPRLGGPALLFQTDSWCTGSEEEPPDRREWICQIHFSSFSWGWIYFSCFERSVWPCCHQVLFPRNHISVFISNKAPLWVPGSHWFISLCPDNPLHFTLYAKGRNVVNAARNDDGWHRESSWPVSWPNYLSLPACWLESELWRRWILDSFLLLGQWTSFVPRL